MYDLIIPNLHCRYYHALQLKLVEASKGSANAEDTDDGDDTDSSDAGEQECKNDRAEDDTRCGDDDVDEEGRGTSPGSSYLGYQVTIKASWFNVAWAKQTHGDDYAMAW